MIRHSFKQSIGTIYKGSKGRYRNTWSLHHLSTIYSQINLLIDYQQKENTTVVLSTINIPKYIATQAIEESRSLLDKSKDYATALLERIKVTIRYLDRIFAYFLYGTPMLVLAPATVAFGSYFPALEEIVWDYCLWSVVQLGPTFIKLAQWASTRPDLFPPRLVERLQSLQDNVRVKYKFDTVEKTLDDAFGENWRDQIIIDPKPIGAGCVAQVFKGTMRSASINSQHPQPVNVAIKMIHPNVESTVKVDMELLSMFAYWLDSFPSLEMLNLGETLTEFGDMMTRQLDLRNEAFNLRLFGKKFKNETWALFPAPIEGFVKKNVLVETLMEGISIVNYMTNNPAKDVLDKVKTAGAGDFDKLKMKLSDLGVRVILKMIFFDNFIHGDLHPGNIMVHFDQQGEPHLVILDCGIVYQAKSEAEHKNLVEICFAFLKHDGRRAGELMLDKAKTTDPEHAKAFCDSVHQMIVDSEDQSYFEHLGEYIGRLCDLARIYSVKLDPGYFAIAMALKVVEGVSLALNHDLDMVSKCVPIIVKTRTLRALGIEKFPLPEKEDWDAENQPSKAKSRKAKQQG